MIKNANSKLLSSVNLSVPNVADVVQGWLSTLTASKISKSIEDGDVIETYTIIRFSGMIQPLSGIELEIKPEGERHWEWTKIYTDYANFEVDDCITIQGFNYRIRHKMPYEKYGYGFYKYECVKDYEDIPEPEPEPEPDPEPESIPDSQTNDEDKE